MEWERIWLKKYHNVFRLAKWTHIMHSKLLNCCKHTHTHNGWKPTTKTNPFSQFNHFDRKNLFFCLPLHNISRRRRNRSENEHRWGRGKNRLKPNANWHTNYKCNFIAANVGTSVAVVNSLSNGLSTADFSTRISMTNRNTFSCTRRVCVDKCRIIACDKKLFRKDTQNLRSVRDLCAKMKNAFIDR